MTSTPQNGNSIGVGVFSKSALRGRGGGGWGGYGYFLELHNVRQQKLHYLNAMVNNNSRKGNKETILAFTSRSGECAISTCKAFTLAQGWVQYRKDIMYRQEPITRLLVSDNFLIFIFIHIIYIPISKIYLFIIQTRVFYWKIYHS